MGLFGFGKKKNEPKNTEGTFYTQCVEDFHAEAKKNGVATRGLIFIPELIPVGERVVLSLLQDPFYQMQFSNNPQAYYYFIMAMSIDAGMLLATQWHEDYSGIEECIARIFEEGPADDANTLLQAHFENNISENQGNLFFQRIFQRWSLMHEPYWKLSDPRKYTFEALTAAYQLGISMILEKYGY